MPRRVVAVEKRRGLGGIANSVHLVLTLCTGGLWLLVWVPWWIAREIMPRKRRTTYKIR
jgi:hypothetical protein